MENEDIRNLTDEELWARTERLSKIARGATFDLVEALAEMDRRGLPDRRVYPSMHAYCVHKLLMTDSAANRHIRAARAVRRFPPIAPALKSGRLSLEAIVVLHPHLEDPDADALVASSLGKSLDEIERLIAPRRTCEARRDVVRRISTAPTVEAPSIDPSTPIIFETVQPTASEAPAPVRFESRAELYASVPENSPVAPKAPAGHSVRIAFTADESFDQLLKEVQAAMRHKYPDGRLEGIFRDALRALLKKNRPWAFPKAERARRA